MGNTGVALARDKYGPFLNAATIVRIDNHSLAFSVNFYTFAATHFSGWHQQGPVDASLFGNVSLTGDRVWSDGLDILPSTLCLFFTIRGVSSEGCATSGFHRGRHKVAFCFGSTESADVGLPALPLHASAPLGSTAQAQSVSRRWNRLYAGPTYSFSPTDSLALGASIQGVYTSDSFIFDSSSVTSTLWAARSSRRCGTSGNGHAFDLAASLGGIYHMEISRSARACNCRPCTFSACTMRHCTRKTEIRTATRRPLDPDRLVQCPAAGAIRRGRAGTGTTGARTRRTARPAVGAMSSTMTVSGRRLQPALRLSCRARRTSSPSGPS